MKLYLIRHGESIANRDRFYAGQSDVPLTEQGRAQAKELAAFLQGITFDKVFSSDLIRARETQKIALPTACAEITPLLREFDCGILVGKPLGTTKESLLSNAEGFSDFDQGETRADLKKRLLRFLSEIENKPWEKVAVFTHNGILNAMLRLVFGDDYSQGSANRNCGVLVFEGSGAQWLLRNEESRK